MLLEQIKKNLENGLYDNIDDTDNVEIEEDNEVEEIDFIENNDEISSNVIDNIFDKFKTKVRIRKRTDD